MAIRRTQPCMHARVQVFPALDRNTPVYAGGYPMQLIQRRMQEYSMWEPSRFHTFKMNQRFRLGPFECAPTPSPACVVAGGWRRPTAACVD